MKIGYVVLYVNDPEASLKFWVEKFGMVEKDRSETGSFFIVRVGFADQDFALELVPLGLMQDNADQLNLGAPSIAFYVANLEETRDRLLQKEVTCSELVDHSGTKTFGFSDNEGRWFGVLQG
jgi:lactoylglutathione lyase